MGLPTNKPINAPIPHAGGKLQIVPAGSGYYQLGFSHMSSSHGMALYQLAISSEGEPLAFVPATGIGGRHRPYPQPSYLAMLISDSQQMWGRICVMCRSYFRTNHVAGMTVCPYCTYADDAIHMLTEAQRLYLRKFANAVSSAIREQRTFEIDLDEATEKAEWTYDELQLQNRFTCSACNVSTDIRGEYGSCTCCGRRNSGGVIHPKLNGIARQLENSPAPEQLSELLKSTVSIFEAMANDLKRILASIPSHPVRRKQVAALDFQDILPAVHLLKGWYGFDISEGIVGPDLDFVSLMFKRRHLFTHTGGRVDERYLEESGDEAFQLHDVIVLSHDEVGRFVPLVRRLATNLINGVEAVEVHRDLVLGQRTRTP